MMRREGLPDRFVVIGGGISGLSSAFYLLREAESRGRDVRNDSRPIGATGRQKSTRCGRTVL